MVIITVLSAPRQIHPPTATGMPHHPNIYIYYSLSSFSITRLTLARCRYYIIILAKTIIVHTQNRTREEKSCSALVATSPRPFYLTIKSTFRRKYIYIYINRRAKYIMYVLRTGAWKPFNKIDYISIYIEPTRREEIVPPSYHRFHRHPSLYIYI